MIILERVNKIYTKNGDRINESTDWVHYFYDPANGWNGSINLQNYSTVYWEHIRELSFNFNKEDDLKKRAYTVYSKEKSFTTVQEKNPFLVYDNEKFQGVTVHKTGGVKYYVSVDLYLNRHQNFLKNLTNAKYVKQDANTEFPNRYSIGAERNYYEKYIYEVLNHNTTAGIKMRKQDFMLLTRRPKLRDNYRYFKFEDRRIILYRYSTIKLKPDDFISPLEKEILKLMTPDYFNGLKELKKSNLFKAHIFCMIALL